MQRTLRFLYVGLILLCGNELNAQWATDGFWLQTGNTMTAQQRDVRLFRFLAATQRGYHVFSGGASNPGSATLSLVEDSVNGWVKLNAGGHDMRFSIDDISRLFIEETNGHVGIGNTTPDYLLDVSGNLGIQTQNPQMIINRTAGSSSAIIKFLDDNTTNASISVNSDGMTLKGGVVGAHLSNAMTLAVNGHLTLPRSVNLNEGNPANLALQVRSDEALWYDDDYFSWGFGGNWNRFARPIRIGDATQPAAGIDLDVQGNVNFSGELTAASDRRLKEEVREISDGLKYLAQLRPVRYRFKTTKFPNLKLPEGERMGLIAQEVEQHLPNLVKEASLAEGKDEGQFAVKSVNYHEMVPLLISAVQELHEDLEKQKALVQELQLEIEALNGSDH